MACPHGRCDGSGFLLDEVARRAAHAGPRAASFIDEAGAVAQVLGAGGGQYPSSPAYDMNRGNSFWNASSTFPRPPLRCLAMIRSAIPSRSDSWS